MQRPDAQGFDEIRIKTVPRYKTSGLSGNEWRISANIELLRKGRIMHEESFHDIESAIKFLPMIHARALDDGKGYFATEEDFCDQEGCADKATVFYRLKKRFCVGGGNCGQEIKMYGEEYRQFCERHSTRGDCGLEDADENYEVTGGKPKEPEISDKKQSLFGGVISIPYPCSDPELSHDCAGCTDRHSEGTHAGCTKQHGHVGCDKAL